MQPVQLLPEKKVSQVTTTSGSATVHIIIRAVPEIILGGATGTFLSCGGVVDVSEGWGVTCPGDQGVFDP